jgi:hypothetical protein
LEEFTLMTLKRILFLGLCLFLAAGYSALAADKEAADAVAKQAEDVAKGKDWASLVKQGQPMAKKVELEQVMHLMKLRKPDDEKRSGLGVGAKPGAITPDGIEAKIINMSKAPMPAARLQKEQEALIQLAERTAAIASIGIHQCPVQAPMGQKTPAKWKELMEDMHKSSEQLIKALKDKNPAKVKEAARRLNANCNDCHAIFRD